MVEVEEADGARAAASGRVQDQGHPIGQVLVDGLVAGHAGGVDMLQLEDDALGPLLRHPLVQPHQRPPQPTLQQHLPLVAALRRQHLPGHVGPPQPLQQQARWLFCVVELVELGWDGHGLAGAYWELDRVERLSIRIR